MYIQNTQTEHVEKKNRQQGTTIRQRGLYSTHRNRQWFRRFTVRKSTCKNTMEGNSLSCTPLRWWNCNVDHRQSHSQRTHRHKVCRSYVASNNFRRPHVHPWRIPCKSSSHGLQEGARLFF